MVAHTYNPSAWEAESGLLKVQGQLGQYIETPPHPPKKVLCFYIGKFLTLVSIYDLNLSTEQPWLLYFAK